MYACAGSPRMTRRVFVAITSCAFWALPRRAWSREGGFIQDVAWSPDGTQLLFSKGDPSGSMHLFLIRPDGSALKQITSGASSNLFGAWSADGSRIAFRSNRDGPTELYLMQNEGSDVRRLTVGGAPNSFPSWSPDGTIAFNSKRTGKWQIFTTSADGSPPVQITNDDWNNENPVYSPDGLHITFQSNRLGKDGIYVVNNDGSGLRLMSNDTRAHVFPAWQTAEVVSFSSSTNADSAPDAVESVRLGSTEVKRIPIKLGFFVRWDRTGTTAAVISGKFPITNLFKCDADGSNLLQLD